MYLMVLIQLNSYSCLKDTDSVMRRHVRVEFRSMEIGYHVITSHNREHAPLLRLKEVSRHGEMREAPCPALFQCQNCNLLATPHDKVLFARIASNSSTTS